VEILVIFILILLNGVFSMSEIALVSAKKSRLETAAKKGSARAKAALELSNNPNKFLSTVQIGITLVGILTGIYSGENITNDVFEYLKKVGIADDYAHSIAVFLIVVLVTYFSLVLGELVPKRIGLANPEGIAKSVAAVMKWLSVICGPFVWLLVASSDLIIKIFRIRPSLDSKVTEEEIKAIVKEGTSAGEVQEIEQDIVERVFSLGDRRVSSLMTHRNDVVALDITLSAEQVRDVVINDLHAVYPVYKEHIDTIAGLIYLKDLFAHSNTPGFTLTAYLKAPQYINENMSAYKVLEKFKNTGVHHGIVTDEYGQMQGLITINDILEALVGDVSEFYKDEFRITKRDDGTYLIDGHYPFFDFLRYFDMEEFAPEYEFNTISGLILQLLETIPQQGDKARWMNFEFEIMDMDGARIDKVLVKVNE
jgi:putative hemolysin